MHFFARTKIAVLLAAVLFLGTSAAYSTTNVDFSISFHDVLFSLRHGGERFALWKLLASLAYPQGGGPLPMVTGNMPA